MIASPLLLIDADVLAFQACAGSERVICFEGDSCFPICSLTDAIAAFDHKLTFICETLNSENFRLCLSDELGNNFRKRVYAGYKANRVGKARPVALGFLRKYLVQERGAIIWPTLEADDVLGIMATDPANTDAIVVSIDKDMLTIPARHYNVGKPEAGIITQSVEDADRRFIIQTLAGDACDGFPGCHGVGQIKAEAALKKAKTLPAMWEAALKLFVKAGFSVDFALTQARLARILRYEDYQKGEIKLWTP